MDVNSYKGISDHFVVRIKIRQRISVKQKINKSVIQKYNIEKLKESKNIQNYIEKINKNMEDNSEVKLDQL